MAQQVKGCTSTENPGSNTPSLVKYDRHVAFVLVDSFLNAAWSLLNLHLFLVKSVFSAWFRVARVQKKIGAMALGPLPSDLSEC